jgi:glycosyltransferase involved in cell wall biosynthesis
MCGSTAPTLHQAPRTVCGVDPDCTAAPDSGAVGSRCVSLAIAHEWLTARAGSEKTFEAMAEAFPDADLYALTRKPGVPFEFGGRTVKTTVLDRWPSIRERRGLTLALMPLAWSLVSRSRRYDIVLTSSHACVRAFPPARDARHYCYCYTPIRYAWQPGLDERTRHPRGMNAVLGALRAWDRRTAGWVDSFAAISTAVRDRIKRFYDRDAVVIHPPVNTEFFTVATGPSERQGVLAVSRFIRYKRLDVAIAAAAIAGLPITVAGSGPDENRLRAVARATGADARFELDPSDERLRELYRTSLALVFPANEDFGIVPVEAQACGTPVVALDEGGARDTVVDGVTGLRVVRQEPRLFAEALQSIAEPRWDPASCRENAARFSRARFVQELQRWVTA